MQRSSGLNKAYLITDMPDAGENTGGRSRANGEGEIEPNNNHHQEVRVSLRANRSQDQMESIREKNP